MKLKKSLIQIIIIIFVTFFVLFSIFLGYFSLNLKAKKDQLEIEKEIYSNSFLLLSNRLSIVSISTLNYFDYGFEDSKNTLIQKIFETNKLGLEKLNSSNNKISKIQDKAIKNRAIAANQKSLEIYQKQLPIVTSYNDFNNLVKNIYLYIPKYDLGVLDMNNDNEQLKERTANAIIGIQNIIDGLMLNTNYKNNPEVNNLITALNAYQAQFKTLENNLSQNKSEDAKNDILKIIVDDKNLKKTAFETEKSILYSPDMVMLLTDQTNLIMEYNYIINNIRENKPLFNFQIGKFVL